MSLIRTAWAVFLVAAVAAPAFAQQTKPPEGIASAVGMFPPGLKAGGKSAVVVSGIRLAGVKAVWCEHPGITIAVKAEGATDTQFSAEVTAKADVPAGLYQWRVIGDLGASAPRMLAVSAFNELNEVEPNDAPDTAAAVPVESAVNGRLEKYTDTDVFKVRGKAGEHVVLSVQALALGTPSRLAMAVTDAGGKLLAPTTDRLDGDPFIDFGFEREEDVCVHVWSLTPGDQPGRVYRLVITKQPVLQFAFPAGGKRGGNATVEIGGFDPAGTLGKKGIPFGTGEFAVPVPASAPSVFEFRIPGKPTVNPIRLAAGDDAETNEVEPNNEPAKATNIEFPSTVNGRLMDRGELDHFAVNLKKGKKIVIDVASRRLGASGDLAVAVLSAAAAQVAANDDRSPDDSDPLLEFTPADDGKFVIRVQEVVPSRSIGPRFFYRLSVREPQPDFSLTTPGPTVAVKPPEGTFSVDVVRVEGFDDDVQLSAAGLPADVTIAPAVIAKGQKTAVLKVTAAPARLGQSVPFTMVGKGKVGGKEVSRPVTCAAPILVVGKTTEATLETRTLFAAISDKDLAAAPAAPTMPTTTMPMGMMPPAAGTVAVLPASAPAWKFIAATGITGVEWTMPPFKDDKWTAAKAPIGYGVELVKSKAGTDLALMNQAVLFRKEFMLDAKLAVPATKFKLLVASDKNATVWINGKQVDADTAPHRAMYWNRMIDIPAGVLVAGRNVLAIQLSNRESNRAFIDVQIDAVPGK